MSESEIQVVDDSSAPPRRTKTAAVEARTYSYGADRRNQRKTTDLVPKRVVSYLGVVMLLLAGLWVINFTSQNAETWSGTIGQSGLKAFAIQGQGSLASWFSSFLLIMTGLASLQIYALRQHRCDDYRGTYRLWLWTALLLILASVNCVTDLGAVAVNLIQTITGSLSGQRAWIPLALKLVALGVLMGRGLYEVGESRGSFALVVFVWVAYSAAAVMQLPAVEQNLVGLGSETMIGNCVLFGTAALFLAHLTYARFIFLHAHGLIVQREKKAKKVKAKSTTKSKRKKRTLKTEASDSDSTVATPKKTKRRKSTKTPVAAESDETEKKQRPAAKTKRAKKTKPTPAKVEQPVKTSSQPEKKSPSDVLKELAAASRAKEQSNQAHAHASSEDDEEHDGIIKMSKSQRRKQRKSDKQRRRAA